MVNYGGFSMTTFTHHRARVNANASLISMVQRFSDILIIFWAYILLVYLMVCHLLITKFFII